MRFIGFILVVLGALALGYQEFASSTSGNTHTSRIPLVVGGIAVVSGLLLVATDSRRGDN
jgi:hypothetical protein